MTMNLKDLVSALNGWPNRPTSREMLKIVKCRYCSEEFPIQSQDHALWNSKGIGFVCGLPTCRTKQAEEHNANRRAKRKGR